MNFYTETKWTALFVFAALVGMAIAFLRSPEFTAMIIRILGG